MLHPSQPRESRPATWPIAALVCGILLLIAGTWLPALMPSSAIWSDAEAAEYTRAAADLHSKSYEASHASAEHGHSHAGGTAAEKAAAQAAFDTIQRRRDSAIGRQALMKYAIQGLGALIALAGIWGYIASKR